MSKHGHVDPVHAKWLMWIMWSRDWTRATLAKELAYTPAFISKICKGQRNLKDFGRVTNLLRIDDARYGQGPQEPEKLGL